jgi:hypothetical protein
MGETIFFNLGNQLAASRDSKELFRMAQIEKDRRAERLVIVKDVNNEEHFLFVLDDQKQPSEFTKEFTVKQILE